MENEFDAKKIAEQVNGSLADAKKIMQEYQKIQDIMKAFTTPIESKNINVAGVNFTAMLYSDRVGIMFPSKNQNVEYYKRIEKILDENEQRKAENAKLTQIIIGLSTPWYKKIFKWLK